MDKKSAWSFSIKSEEPPQTQLRTFQGVFILSRPKPFRVRGQQPLLIAPDDLSRAEGKVACNFSR